MKKTAITLQDKSIPVQVLNPLQAAKSYSFHSYAPSIELADYIDSYWVMRWDLREKAPFTCKIVSSPFVTITLMSYGAQVTGITTGVYEYKVFDTGVIYGAMFKPGAFKQFYADSLSTLTDQVVPAETIFPALTSELNGRVLSASDDLTGLAMIENMLTEHPRNDAPDMQQVQDIIQYAEHNPTTQVADIAAKFGISERRLQDLFRNYVGVGLKWIMLRRKLQTAVTIAAKPEIPNWTELATELNYADQSHFINEFKRIIGESPTHYRNSIFGE